MFKPFVENIEKFSSRYHKYIKSPTQVNNSDLKLGIIFEFIKFIKIKEKIENSNETSHTLKHLLLKCQSTIQELQGELEKSREEKTIFLDQIKNLKHQQFELEGIIKEEEIEKEKIQEELKTKKIENIERNEKKNFLEEKIKSFKERDHLYEEIKEKFNEICEENQSLQSKNENLQNKLDKREELEREWDLLLINIKTKLKFFKQENIALKQDNINLNQTVENMKIIANEKENIRNILLGKESDIEKKTKEIIQLTQDLEIRTQELEMIHRNFEDVQDKTQEKIEQAQREFDILFRKQDKELNRKFQEEYEILNQKNQKEKEEIVELIETKISMLKKEKQEIIDENKRIIENNDFTIQDLKKENKKKLDEKEEKFREEIKKTHLILKDQNEIICSFEEKIEKSLENQKFIQLKFNEQLEHLYEDKKRLEHKNDYLQNRYNNLCKSIETEYNKDFKENWDKPNETFQKKLQFSNSLKVFDKSEKKENIEFSEYDQILSPNTKRMPNTNRESESNYYFQEKKYKYPQIIYEKPIALTETKKKILINPNYNLEMTIPEISTSDKIIELSQRNKIKSMYENQNNISSSNSRGFLNQFKKVVGKLDNQMDKISNEIKINDFPAKAFQQKDKKF